MKSRIVPAAALAAAAALQGPAAFAHHSIAAEFDVDATISFTGTVTDVEWYNPHIWIDVDVAGEQGVEKWQCEMGAPNRLIRLGWRKEDLPPGTVVNVSGNPARDGSNTCNARRVTLSDGRLMFQGDTAKEISP